DHEPTRRGAQVRFPISVLSQRTGTPVATIHYYRRIGLLPEAVEVASNRFLYDDRHVEALTVIRLLREHRSMPLETIRDLLPELASAGDPDTYRTDLLEKVIATQEEPTGQVIVSNLIVAASRDLFSRRGYAGVNIADICHASGIAKGSFYRYFESKEAVFVAAARSTVDAVGSGLDAVEDPMSESQATERLRRLLSPLAPLLLEVAVGEMRHQNNVSGVVAAIAAGLAIRLAPRLRARGKAAHPTARRVVDDAFSKLLEPALGTSST
ncbi:MAG TPA: MerR family transcriptional regulator, partial [Acidimicrobiales bacterium]|nr:MerR family transcriptional regulator [Acidimicrobiales bacterium]